MDYVTANALLDEADINISLNEDAMQRLTNSTSPKLLNDALHQAANDPGAKRWVTETLNKVLVNQKTRRPASQQQATPPRQQAPVDNAQLTQANSSKPTTEDRIFKGHTVYGSQSALYAGADITRSGVHTLRLEGAKSVEARKYNWDQKIAIQLTQDELPHVACVLYGWVQQCEYKNHGPAKNKGFKLMIQKQQEKTGLFVNIMEASKPMCAIPVSTVDLYHLRNLTLGQIMKNEPDLDSAAVLSSLKAYAGMLT